MVVNNCRLELEVEDDAIRLDSLESIRIMGFKKGRSLLEAHTCGNKLDGITENGQQN